MKLTSENVWEIFRDCLFKNEEPHDNAIMVKGVVATFGFHPDRLEKHRDDIFDMLKQLPDQFQMESGGGWSFIKAPFDKDNNQWGEQRNAEQLLALGMAINKVKPCMTGLFADMLPGGVPYYVVMSK